MILIFKLKGSSVNHLYELVTQLQQLATSPADHRAGLSEHRVPLNPLLNHAPLLKQLLMAHRKKSDKPIHLDVHTTHTVHTHAYPYFIPYIYIYRGDSIHVNYIVYIIVVIIYINYSYCIYIVIIVIQYSINVKLIPYLFFLCHAFTQPQDFYLHMLSLVDGSSNVDLCGMEGTKRSTQCYGFEFLWHVVPWLR